MTHELKELTSQELELVAGGFGSLPPSVFAEVWSIVVGKQDLPPGDRARHFFKLDGF